AYTMQYGEPFTHTGALATYKANDQLSLMGGFTFGWNNFDNVYNRASFLGGATFTASDGNSSLAFALSIGDEEETFGTTSPVDTRYIQSVVYSRTLTDRLSYVFQSDYGQQDDGADGGTTSASWYGVNQYLFYKINCCWSAGVRAEWFRDDDGVRVAPAGDYARTGDYPNSNPASIGGFEGNFYEVTLGLNYKPSGNPNFVFRPEVRYDWYSGNPSYVDGTSLPYDDANNLDQVTYGFDMIYLY
ncbi:MAG: outer membrane beta-barrel protein, partial [Planctomycetota bacterium]|nr:outer membrane beta-barrel protein [Planctomycetota bacterium]